MNCSIGPVFDFQTNIDVGTLETTNTSKCGRTSYHYHHGKMKLGVEVYHIILGALYFIIGIAAIVSKHTVSPTE